MSKDIYERALHYHKYPTPGKFKIQPTKPLADQRDLALAYSPGVAAASLAIKENPDTANDLTLKGNLIAVITNGTAVLGLGDIGPLASKPVMEGKAVLFKKFAGIDTFDIEIDEKDPESLIKIIKSLEPTFGGINLEDIKAPECFHIEKTLSEKMKIPVFHDDQHGTAIIVVAAVMNALELVKKKAENLKVVVSGAGAAAIACLELLEAIGISRKQVIMCDRTGVIYKGRDGINDIYKKRYEHDLTERTLEDAMKGADMFLGVSAGGVVSKKMVKSMADNPIILALANPDPEILPEDVKEARSDAIIATGRSDYENQVNNVLCFPYIFRGALDVGATCINTEMKIACAKAIASLAKKEASHEIISAYGSDSITFGPKYIIPKPFDPRLIMELSPIVAQAAMDSGVATRPIEDMDAYRLKLKDFVDSSNLLMRPIIKKAQRSPKRITFAEGEEEKVLRAAQIVVDEGIGFPILIGRPEVIEVRIKRMCLRIKPGKDFEVINPNDDDRYRTYWEAYHKIMGRRGITPDVAKLKVRTCPTVIGALTVHLGDSDGLICGVVGQFLDHLNNARKILGVAHGVRRAASLGCVLLDDGPLFICDPYVNEDPSAEDLVDMTFLAAEEVKQFGLIPKIALISHSNYGSGSGKNVRKMQRVFDELKARAPELMVDGEMHAEIALNEYMRKKSFPESTFDGRANILIMPSIESANISLSIIKATTNGTPIGPMLIGMKKPVHVLTSTSSVRSIVNMAARAVVSAEKD
jgi:malate dehydrogenase (oxaloacetate-decarboxylating)(NADP+)